MYIEIKSIKLLIPVDSDFSADLNLCKSTCAISSIKYIIRNPHITSISANGSLQNKNKGVVFERVLSHDLVMGKQKKIPPTFYPTNFKKGPNSTYTY